MFARATLLVGVTMVMACLIAPAWGETIDTRIGKIELENGYPSAESVKRLFDEMDFQRATQAYVWALPAVGFHGLHLAHLNSFGAKDGDVVLYQDLKDKAGMLTPNLTTLYIMTLWNLAEQGPLVIEVPAGATAGGFLDIWQRPITDVGQTGPDRGGGGKYLIVPPGSDIQEMPGYIGARSPSNQVWFASRMLDRDPQAAEAMAHQHKVYAWNDRDHTPKTKFVPVGGKAWTSAQPAGLGGELDQDQLRKGVVPLLPLLCATASLFRQELAAQRHRTGRVTATCRLMALCGLRLRTLSTSAFEGKADIPRPPTEVT